MIMFSLRISHSALKGSGPTSTKYKISQSLMHVRNLHKNGYPIAALCQSFPALTPFVINAKSGNKSINFADPNAVMALNSALLKHYYKVDFWEVPKGYLCPPVPGRADYIHAIADLLVAKPPQKTNTVRGLDIGVGANAIYPIIGVSSYQWEFVGSDIDEVAFVNASRIAKKNAHLSERFSVRKQAHSDHIFKGVIKDDDYFTFTMCNPPFHKSQEDALSGTRRKTKNLKRNVSKRGGKSSAIGKAPANLNFAGQANELWCNGGELAFIQRMIEESTHYKTQVGWFTCLVSKSAHLKPLETSIRYHQASEFDIVEMGQGNKLSRFVAWRF